MPLNLNTFNYMNPNKNNPMTPVTPQPVGAAGATTRPTNPITPSGGLNNAMWAGMAQNAAAKGIQATPDQYSQAGGNLGDYSNNYGATSWYNPDGSYTPNAPSWVPRQAAQEQGKADASLLFPQFRQVAQHQAVDYVPAAKQVQNNPLYEWQKQQGLGELEKLMAARGLTNSGAELQANSDFLSKLGAQESLAQRQFAQSEAQRAQDYALGQQSLGSQYDQTIAQRLLGMKTDQANRQEAAGTQQWNRLMDMLGLSLAQNPMSYAMQGTGGLADAYGAEGNTMADYLARISSANNGAAAAAAANAWQPTIPPAPTGPDFSAINAFAPYFNAAANAQQGNTWSNIFAGILSNLGT